MPLQQLLVGLRPLLAVPLTSAALLGPAGAFGHASPDAPAARPAAERPAVGAEVVRRLAAMGTSLELRVEAADRAAALAASEAAVRAIEAAEARLSTWREDSELARLNRAPVGAAHALSPALADDLAAAARWCRATDGAFDPVVGALVSVWDLRGGGRRPSEPELRRALAGTGLARVELGARTLRRLHAAATLEEGGFGKGVGLDAALRALERAGARAALLDLGGQIALLPGTEPARVALADPRERRRPVLALRLTGGSVATSGNGERGLVVDGRRIGHLLDPRSGRPAEDFGSLTVCAPDATTADCLATGLYVLGPERALEWAAAHPEALRGGGVVVLEPRADGSLLARASASLRGRLEPLTADLELRLATPEPDPTSPSPLPESDRAPTDR